MSRQRRWDIFCTVVDNFGDVGVTWRLARQLVREFDKSVCLWVDNLAALQKLCPDVDPTQAEQSVAGVLIRDWRQDGDTHLIDAEQIEVVIEAFACHLSEPYLEALAQHSPQAIWLNLEYLSAEDWVDDCHGLPSIHPRLPLTKYFFFPGFSERTGGLLRERDLIRQRREFQRDSQTRQVFLESLDVVIPAGARVYSLFSYESPAISDWLSTLAAAQHPSFCLVPEGRSLAGVREWLGESPDLRAGQRHVRGQLTLQVLPFLPQDDYDRLLWSCDFNVVRGEDSLVRAHWAGRPFCWQIYPQADAAHLAKLDAFLDLFLGQCQPALVTPLRAAMRAWSGAGEVADAWQSLQALWPQWQQACTDWADRLAARPDLAAALVDFCDAHQPRAG